ncbi:MAG: nickel pincer cofactor biosynthesis protein LarC [Roseiflexaceae bacterium]
MSNAIYFDCFSGISGDMALGALLDAGLSLDALRTELDKLQLDGWSVDAERGIRRYLSGTRALVHAPEQAIHRHLSDVQSIIDASALAPELKQRAIHVFTLLAAAEGQVHGIPAGQVHFHEVGALDAIIDIVGVVAGLALLGINEVYASALPLGTGWTRAAHGALPLPAPAVLALLAGARAPTIPDDTLFELVTPTGAALLAGLAEFRRPPLRIERVGYGLGARDLERPNVLRVWLGETDKPTKRQADKQIGANSISLPPVLLETNIDDQPAEQLAYAVERLFALGALDAWLAPIQMKKGRAATLLSALVPAELEDAAVALLMRETSTLGLRRRAVERHVAEREIVDVETPLGPVRIKHKRWQGQDMGAAPEYEDCARLAREHGLPLREVYGMALSKFKVTGEG